jgi:hypothetical protein
MIDSDGEPSFCLRSASVMPAKQTPLATAMTLPSDVGDLEAVREEQRHAAEHDDDGEPVGARGVRSPRNQAPNRATQTGAVYWSRMALAAVVSLVARQKVTVQAA